MTKEVIILVGGLGKRLRESVSDVPKPMAPIDGKPFLYYLFKYLGKYGIKHVVLSVGYMGDIIQKYFGDNFNGIEIDYAIEHERLGTGGGIMNAMEFVDNDVFIINGDTFFNVDLYKLNDFSDNNKSNLTLSLKHIDNVESYGSIEIDELVVSKFIEKQQDGEGLINGGLYHTSKSYLLKFDLPHIFSFEKDFLEKYYSTEKFTGYESDTDFLDIGIPLNYEKFKRNFKTFIS